MVVVAEARSTGVTVSLDAVVVAVTDETPKVLAVAGPSGGPPRLPSGRLEPGDRTLELALRRFVREQAGLEVGYVEQLYTFGDLRRGRSGGEVPASDGVGRLLTVAYVALVRETDPSPEAAWVDGYELYPWEDHRGGRPALLNEVVAPVLEAWVEAAPALHRASRLERAHVTFGLGGAPWDGVRVLERYELLYEVGLLAESDRRPPGAPALGAAMQRDDRRIVATALGRLRGKLTYRPVVFELLPRTFTLLQLQRLVEALSGMKLHKGNFRRLVEGAGLVEGTGSMAPTGGRPAELFRFRREVLRERPRPGVGTPWTRT
ncbi:MAG: hypothetical protein GEV08_23510 [Acidimicrobiia bacterium]|nr:hypothetical protein [Acidimicrobiia bacterium]